MLRTDKDVRSQAVQIQSRWITPFGERNCMRYSEGFKAAIVKKTQGGSGQSLSRIARITGINTSVSDPEEIVLTICMYGSLFFHGL